jgi:hypothetical protein
MGPLQNADSKKRVLDFSEKGISEGAKLTLDGRNLNLEGDVPETCFLNPRLFKKIVKKREDRLIALAS